MSGIVLNFRMLKIIVCFFIILLIIIILTNTFIWSFSLKFWYTHYKQIMNLAIRKVLKDKNGIQSHSRCYSRSLRDIPGCSSCYSESFRVIPRHSESFRVFPMSFRVIPRHSGLFQMLLESQAVQHKVSEILIYRSAWPNFIIILHLSLFLFRKEVSRNKVSVRFITSFNAVYKDLKRYHVI